MSSSLPNVYDSPSRPRFCRQVASDLIQETAQKLQYKSMPEHSFNVLMPCRAPAIPEFVKNTTASSKVFLQGPFPAYLFANYLNERLQHRAAYLVVKDEVTSQSKYDGTPKQIHPTFYLDYVRFCSGKEKESVLHLNSMFDAQFYNPFAWDVRLSPATAIFDGKLLPEVTTHAQVFVPALSTITIFVGFQDGTAPHNTEWLQPEPGQRLIGFPVSVHSCPTYQEMQVKLENLDPSPPRHPNPLFSMTVHVLLDGIFRGMWEAFPKECWAELSLREKFILATRLSRRRHDQLPTPDFLNAAIHFEINGCEFQNGVHVGEALAEAHARLDHYAFGVTHSSRGKPVECVRVLDFLGDQARFKGLRWTGLKVIGEAFYLSCA
ncbi:uncharacterized protein FOMMEDRAFT_160043 [Fomitiporia mediterranea MF3/22]|uniref:uncharacterized protein n=1 Tax=Fomitiporia mediterranea (strain MF3/22) TaxID=694068 RepID=UPI00044098B6|nr:uncharacterized protein FOMMEDRAFT_160043 [Fomitiporia mediterranea MF3/22]EJC99618.1 hypothetical protein FOMMEDRAFT_160043 [Fomitiporia mediterranea MF3/22]